MTKFFPALIAITFLASAVIGYNVAAELYQSPSQNLALEYSTPAPGSQKNFLIIQVDSIEARQPVLQSLWILFYRSANGPYVIFKAAFPTGTTRADLAVLKQFSLNSNGEPAANFLSYIAADLDINLDGYLVLDQAALTGSLPWLEKSAGDLSSWMQALCSSGKKASGKMVLQASLAKLSPGHIQSSGKLKDILGSLESGTGCEILP